MGGLLDSLVIEDLSSRDPEYPPPPDPHFVLLAGYFEGFHHPCSGQNFQELARAPPSLPLPPSWVGRAGWRPQGWSGVGLLAIG